MLVTDSPLPAGRRSGRARLAPAALRTSAPPTARAMTWLPVAVAAVVAVTAVVHGLVAAPDHPALAHVARLRLAMIVLAAGCGFALDDPAADTTAASPVTRSRRHLVRLALVAVAWTAAWAAVLALASTAGGPLPAVLLTVEALGWLSMSLAVGACCGGTAAGPALLASYLLMLQLPQRLTLVAPLDGGWSAVHSRWSAIAAAGVLVVAWTALDPARRRPWTRPR